MGRAASSSTNSTTSTTSLLSSLPSFPPLSTLVRKLSTASTRHASSPTPPFQPSITGVTIGSATRLGLLHKLRGAPLQDVNAIILPSCQSYAVVSIFSSHGKYGKKLATVAATTLDRHVRWAMRSKQYDLEKVLSGGFVDASIAIDDMVESGGSGCSGIVVLVSGGVGVVGTLGRGYLMIARRAHGSSYEVELVGHGHGLVDEAERVERFGGVSRLGGGVVDFVGGRELAVTRCFGATGMRKVGVCQVPSIERFEIHGRDEWMLVSSLPLWGGEGRFAPRSLCDVFKKIAKGMDAVEVAERLVQEAFGKTGPTSDVTLLCAKLA